MLNINAGIETFKYWDRMHETCAEHAAKVNRDSLRAELLRQRSDLDAIIGAIERVGIAVVSNYWSAGKCAAARAEIDRLMVEYPGAVKAYSGGSDNRMFGVEATSALLAEFHYDRFLRGVGELIGGLTLYNFATLGARIEATPENNGSGDGWHRDGHGFQFKSILYLCDVTEENGPFEFLPGSHTRWRAGFDTITGNLPPAPKSRYEPAAIDRMNRWFGTRRRRYLAKAGTLLLVNTSGIHRGRPLMHGTRYALTNYYYHPFQVGESRIEQFSPLMPGTAARIRADLHLQ